MLRADGPAPMGGQSGPYCPVLDRNIYFCVVLKEIRTDGQAPRVDGPPLVVWFGTENAKFLCCAKK